MYRLTTMTAHAQRPIGTASHSGNTVRGRRTPASHTNRQNAASFNAGLSFYTVSAFPLRRMPVIGYLL